MNDILAGFFAAFLASVILVEVCRRWMEQRKILDIPNERSSHVKPVPRGGGLAIVVVCLAGWLIALPSGSHQTGWAVTLLAAVFVAAVSWLDDVRSLHSIVRLLAHSLTAAVVLLVWQPWRALEIPSSLFVDLGFMAIPLSFVWVVGLTNAYNFMDGIDGIAGMQGVIAGLAWMALAPATDNPMIGRVAVLLAAANLGFLIHNWSPARIFMGDVGSAFLGFTLAALPLASQRDRPLFAFCGLLVVWPFVFDTVFTLLRRARRREALLQAHRSHLYQRLTVSGLGHGIVSLLYGGLAAMGGLAAFLLANRARVAGLVALAMIVAAAIGLWTLVVFREDRAASPRLERS